ncbi:MAG: sulfurtransferase-like selenium metabolism protein YedF [Porphyromonas sp.]|nr:sulfurtransferase-like selenium metabolism protein YedF [Porphyromonas sp.]
MAIEIDTRGKLCPLPLIMLRRALKSNPHETCFEVFTDNETSCANLSDFVAQSGFSLQITAEEGFTVLTVDTTGRPVVPNPSDLSDPVVDSVGIRPVVSVIQLRSDKMGRGDDELGDILIQAYLNALKEIEELPTHIICYNSAVLLATRDRNTHVALRGLYESGVEIIVCGTCVDYYDVKDKLAVGQISNMLVIAELLSRADHIVAP